jgi:hypothetical protein
VGQVESLKARKLSLEGLLYTLGWGHMKPWNAHEWICQQGVVCIMWSLSQVLSVLTFPSSRKMWCVRFWRAQHVLIYQCGRLGIARRCRPCCSSVTELGFFSSIFQKYKTHKQKSLWLLATSSVVPHISNCSVNNLLPRLLHILFSFFWTFIKDLY